MSISNVKIVQSGCLIELNEAEIEYYRDMSANGSKYKYFTEGEYVVEFTLERGGETLACRVSVPEGFLSDGDSGGPDRGLSWLFHDYVYATHSFARSQDGSSALIDCSRCEADELMSEILKIETISTLKWYTRLYERGFTIVSKMNVLWLFSKAWYSSGARGPEFIESRRYNGDDSLEDVSVD